MHKSGPCLQFCIRHRLWSAHSPCAGHPDVGNASRRLSVGAASNQSRQAPMFTLADQNTVRYPVSVTIRIVATHRPPRLYILGVLRHNSVTNTPFNNSLFASDVLFP